MAWGDLFRQARDFLGGGWGGKAGRHEPTPPPRYHRGPIPQYNPAPPEPPGSQVEPPPVDPRFRQPPRQPDASQRATMFDRAMYDQIVSIANDIHNASTTNEQVFNNVQHFLDVARQIRSQGVPEEYQHDLDRSIRAIAEWIDNHAGFAVRSPTNYPIADIQNWPEEYREDVTPEAVVTKTPGSSNVYSFVWVSDEHTITDDGGISVNPFRSRSSDIGSLIVTFKEWEPGMKQKDRPNSPGSTYAYASVPRSKYEMFLGATSPDSAGYAVWDYLRIRGTQSGHQHAYRLVSVTGEYVPRMATPTGFGKRRHRMLSVSPGNYDAGSDETPWIKTTLQSTLPPGPLTRFGAELPEEGRVGIHGATWSAVSYAHRGNGGYPNRGAPNRGRR